MKMIDSHPQCKHKFLAIFFVSFSAPKQKRSFKRWIEKNCFTSKRCIETKMPHPHQSSDFLLLLFISNFNNFNLIVIVVVPLEDPSAEKKRSFFLCTQTNFGNTLVQLWINIRLKLLAQVTRFCICVRKKCWFLLVVLCLSGPLPYVYFIYLLTVVVKFNQRKWNI